MGKRESKVVRVGITGEQFEESMALYAVSDAKAAKLNATLDGEIAKLREKYASDLKKAEETKSAAWEVIETYCKENQAELFSKKKSMETAHGVVGFRTGTHKLVTLRGYTWNAVLALVKEIAPAYVRTKEELNKELLLAQREEQAELLPRLGVKVEQDEAFFIELKKEAV